MTANSRAMTMNTIQLAMRPLADKDHHAGRDQQLVGQRIEELAEIRDLIIMARDVAVDKIADARDHEHAERRPAQRVIPARCKAVAP